MLSCIAPRSIRVGMHFEHQPIVVEVQGFLRHIKKHFPVAANVAAVANEGHVWKLPFQLNGQLPSGLIAVCAVAKGTETTVDDADLTNAGAINALNGTNPQFHIGIDGVFDQHRDVGALKGVGDLLHGKRIDGRPCTNPQNIDAILQRLVHVMRVGHFRANLQTRFFFYPAQPWQGLGTDSFKIIWPCTRFPHTGAEKVDSGVFQAMSRFHYLRFGFRAARARDPIRALALTCEKWL